jgi:hypothetical protein
MRTTVVVCVVIAFLVVLTMGLITRGSRITVSKPSDTLAADRASIEKLRNADIAATLTQDPSALIALWSDDGVDLQTPGAPVVGLKALKERYDKFRIEHPEFEVLKYSPDFKDLQIMDGWAIEAGDTNAHSRCPQRTIPLLFNKSFCVF